VRSRISLVDADLQSWLQLFRQHSMFVVAALLAPDFVADPDDAKVLACAIAGSAQFVMTGDRHLRVLGVFRGIEIVAPASFLGELERGD
jgi:predicted nucleic acid-binding protein